MSLAGGLGQIRRERGFALVIVLWTLGLIALIGTQVTAAGHGEARVAANLRSSAVAEAAADGALEEAALHLIDTSRARWVGDGAPYATRVGQVAVTIAIENEQRKLPLNTSPTALLAAVLKGLGVGARQSAVLADQIGDWRSPANFPLKLGAKAPQYRAAGRIWGPANRPFRTVGELRLLLDMTPEIYARLAPHVSAFTESAPQVKFADPVVQEALREVAAGGLQPLAFDESPTYKLMVVAVAPDGARFVRRAVIRINLAAAGAPVRRPFDVLAWASGEDDPAID